MLIIARAMPVQFSAIHLSTHRLCNSPTVYGKVATATATATTYSSYLLVTKCVWIAGTIL
ncbi:hypothetical protein PVAP13_9KG529178 [Panicum virgatum]|uniref:Uncharacterized protein n=1 Tax=Panicum virgatum TaxID=38727 RepID=A0A8T0NVF3_PANVG|nr:hypothetical protein PVAP13_9KG529178 [Panicum virgatum]